MVLAAPTYRRFAVAPATLRRSRLPDHLSACSLRKPLLGISLPVAPVPRLSRRLQGAERSAFDQHIYFLLLLSDLDPLSHWLVSWAPTVLSEGRLSRGIVRPDGRHRSYWLNPVLTPACHIATSIEAEDYRGARHLGAT